MLALAAAVAIATAPPPITPSVRREVAALRARRGPPLVWLGERWRGLSLVHVEEDAGSVDLFYADCGWFDLNTASPRCRRGVDLELWPIGQEHPAISFEAGGSRLSACPWVGTIRGAPAARFDAQAGLHVYLGATTAVVSADDALAAARALRPLNFRGAFPAPTLPIRRELARCHGLRPLAQPKPTQSRYEQVVAGAISVGANTLTLESLSPRGADAASMVASMRQFAALLRNVAAKLERRRAPAPVAAEQAALVARLRAYAGAIDAGRALVAAGAWSRPGWPAQAAALDRRYAAAAKAIAGAVRAYRARGYDVTPPKED